MGIAALAESTENVQSPKNCDRVSHTDQEVGDEMSAVQMTVQHEPQEQEDVALEESSGDSQATERVRSVKEEEDAAMEEGFGDRQATTYLNTLAKYEADKIAHPGYQNTAPDLQGIPDYASKLERQMLWSCSNP